MIKAQLFIFLFFSIISVNINGQEIVADKIIGVVGKSAILYSEVEEQYLQMAAQRQPADRCQIFEDLLAQKLLVTQAAVDSIEVSVPEVEIELEQRLTYFINQIGTEEKLVEYFGKSILEIKDDMRETVREQLLMQRMQGEIVSGLSITPNEVKTYYNKLHKDSIPYIDSELEINQITIYPQSDEDAVFEVREKLLKLRERVLNGESFATMAVLYSEGPSSSRGGDIGWSSKAELDPAYAKAAFALKEGQVSKIVESSFGFHIIQLVDKTENRVKTRHILMKPKVTYEEKQKASRLLDSLARAIRFDSIKFETAAMYFSHDEDTRMNGGARVNPQTQTTKFRVDEFPTSEYYVIRNLSEGQISKAFESTDDKGKTVYKIVQLKSRTEPHTANLSQDYTLIKNMALQTKQTKIIDEWVIDIAKDTYIRIEDPYNKCNFRVNAWNKF
jgi:peptidyl-prolyl cis-trans isomerase SurA